MASKRSYSLLYRIYRRARFLCHAGRKARAARREALRRHHLEESARRAEVKHLDKLYRSEINQRRAERKKNRALEKKLNRQQSDRLYWRYLKDSMQNFWRSLSPEALRKAISGLWIRRKQNVPGLIISINSTSMFILAYIGMWLVSQFMTILAASLFSYPTILYFHRLYFDISQSAWFQDSVITIYLAGPLACLVAGFIALAIFSKLREKTGFGRLLLWWTSMMAVTMVFGGLISGVIFEGGLGYVLDWLYVSDSQRVFIMAIALAIMLIAGILLSRPFLYTGNINFNELDRKGRHYLFWMQMVIPFFLGSTILSLVRQPQWMIYDTVANITMVLGIFAATGHQWTGIELYFDEEPRKIKLSWPWILAAVVVLAVYRLGLDSGIRFG